MSTRIGVDVGGTFTDLIAYDGESGEVTLSKSASTADAPEQAVIESVAAGVPPEVISTAEFFLHGTTVALNALLTRSGAKLGLLATAGFRDVLEVRRGSREEMLNLWWRPPEPLVPRELRIPIGERIRADGTIQAEVPDEDVAAAAEAFSAPASKRFRSRSSTPTATPPTSSAAESCDGTASRGRSRSRTGSPASTGSSSGPRRP